MLACYIRKGVKITGVNDFAYFPGRFKSYGPGVAIDIEEMPSSWYQYEDFISQTSFDLREQALSVLLIAS